MIKKWLIAATKWKIKIVCDLIKEKYATFPKKIDPWAYVYYDYLLCISKPWSALRSLVSDIAGTVVSLFAIG